MIFLITSLSMSLPCFNFSSGSPHLQDKSQLFSMACEAPWNLALAGPFSLVSSSSCTDTALGPQWITQHSQSTRPLSTSLPLYTQFALHGMFLPSPPYLSPLLMPLHFCILSFLSKFLLSWVRSLLCDPTVFHEYLYYHIYYTVL